MLFRLSNKFIFLILFPLLAYTGYSFYTYFTELRPPLVELIGITNNGYCSKITSAAFKANTPYKIAELKVTLDGQPFDFGHNPRIKSKKFVRNFDLNTTQLSDGPHTLEFEAIDASYHANSTTTKINFIVDNAPLNAAFIKTEYTTQQGHTLHAQIQTNKKLQNIEITFLSKKHPCFQTTPHSFIYECFIPIDCEEKPGNYNLTAELTDHIGNSTKLAAFLTVTTYNFPKQKGFTVSTQKLDEEREVSLNTNILEEALDKWVTDSPKEKTWAGPFELPTVVKRISTPFGEVRMTPERGRYLHKAIDIVNTPRSVVWASQTGKVIIKERYLMHGNTVVLDHGLGIFTLYCHLEEFADIEVGDIVKKGNPLGKLGKTGYAAGYHLHWEVRVNNIQVDPMEWTTKAFWE